MIAWQRILVAVQVDSSSAEVLEQAGQLALWSGAHVELIHVFETPGYGGPTELAPVEGRVAQEGLEPWRSAKAMAGMMNTLLDRGVQVTKGHMLHGVVEELLVQKARLGGFGLLVVGNHHPSRLERTFSGDVVGVLTNRCPCPLLIVPHE